MVRVHWLAVAMLALSGVSAKAAGPVGSWLFPDDTLAPAYSPFRYWAPGFGRVYDHFHSPRLSVYAPDRHPEVSPNYAILTFPHPPVEPAATIFTRPTPPPESKFRYFGARE